MSQLLAGKKVAFLVVTEGVEQIESVESGVFAEA
ncbi:hypothetical protein ABH939_006438 [Rhodococcus sp. 27YEA6]